jgi:hypothetical protein
MQIVILIKIKKKQTQRTSWPSWSTLLPVGPLGKAKVLALVGYTKKIKNKKRSDPAVS